MNLQQIQLAGSLLQLVGWMAPVVVIAILLMRINARYGVGIGGAPVLSGGVVMILTLLFKTILQYQFGTAHGLFQIVSHFLLLLGSIIVVFGTSRVFEIMITGKNAEEIRQKKKKIWTILLLIFGGSVATSAVYGLVQGSPVALMIFSVLYSTNISIVACIYWTVGLLWLWQRHAIHRWFPWAFFAAGALLMLDGVMTASDVKFHVTPIAYFEIRALLGLVTGAAGIVAVVVGYIGTNKVMLMLAPTSVNASILHYKSTVQKRFVLVLTISILVIGVTGYMILEVIQSSRHSIEDTYLNEQRKVAESVAANMEGVNSSMLQALNGLSCEPAVKEINKASMRKIFSASLIAWKNIAFSISRIDEHGILRYVYPEIPGVAGRDISFQHHVQRFLRVRDTIFSGVFTSIQGERAFALYVPVHTRNRDGKGTHFTGAVAFLVHLDPYGSRAFRNTSIFTSNPLAAVNSHGTVIVSSKAADAGVKVQDYLREIFPAFTNQDSLNAVTKRISTLSSPAFIRVVNSPSEPTPQWLVAHPVSFAGRPLGVIILPVSNSEIYSVYTETAGRQLIIWGVFAVVLVLLLGTVVVIFYRWSRFLEEEVNHELKVVREAEGKYAKLVTEAVVGIFQTTADGRLTSANPSMASMLGYASADALIASDVFTATDVSSRAGMPWEEIRKSAGVNTRVAIRKADGTVMNALIHCKAVGETDRTIDRYEGFIEDITERNRLEQQLIQAQKLEGIGTLAGGIAHDFNNLLAMILGSAELLRFHTREHAQLKKYVDRIIEASERGASISRQLLIFSRPDQAELQPISLSHLIAELEEMLKHFLPKSVTVETRINVGGENCIMGDGGHLHQALLNLALNANDAMPGGGSLTISASTADYETVQKSFPACERAPYVCVSVADTGMGMDESVKAKMFDPFFSTKERGKGTGLGLAIVHGIVKSHKGFIDVESIPGKGTVFTLYFPVIAADADPRKFLSGTVTEDATHETMAGTKRFT